MMKGKDPAHSLRLFELRLAEAGRRVIPGKRQLTEEEARVLIEGRNDCARTHPVDFHARSGEAVCPPPVRPRNACEPLSDSGCVPMLHDYLRSGRFIGDREFVLEQARRVHGSADPGRLVVIDADADLYCYCRPDARRIARERARQALADARERASLEAAARREAAAARKTCRANSRPARPAAAVRRNTPTGPVTAIQVFLWRRAQEALRHGEPHDPADRPPALSLLVPYAWRHGDDPPSSNPLAPRDGPLDIPILHYLPRTA